MGKLLKRAAQHHIRLGVRAALYIQRLYALAQGLNMHRQRFRNTFSKSHGFLSTRICPASEPLCLATVYIQAPTDQRKEIIQLKWLCQHSTAESTQWLGQPIQQ